MSMLRRVSALSARIAFRHDTSPPVVRNQTTLHLHSVGTLPLPSFSRLCWQFPLSGIGMQAHPYPQSRPSETVVPVAHGSTTPLHSTSRSYAVEKLEMALARTSRASLGVKFTGTCILSIRQEKFNYRCMHVRLLDGQLNGEQVFASARIAVMLGEVEGLDFRTVVQELRIAHAVAQARQVQVFERPGKVCGGTGGSFRVVRVAAVRWRREGRLCAAVDCAGRAAASMRRSPPGSLGRGDRTRRGPWGQRS